MKNQKIACLFLLCFYLLNVHLLNAQEKSIFVWGGDINAKFTQYVADLTQKENPKVCYLPTASADNADNLKYWENICGQLKIDTLICKVWVSSSEKNSSFEDILLNSDAIVVGGGNTLNMLGIWKAQGIDSILMKAYNKGIILAGGSAGSICWFTNGISDSRPRMLSSVSGLNLLPYSNCPHYDLSNRKELYHKMIQEQTMPNGYAFDEKAGVLFRNGEAVDFVSQSDKHNSYSIYRGNGRVESQKLNSRIILRRDALPKGSYSSVSINKKVGEISTVGKPSPLTAYLYQIENVMKNKSGDIKVEQVFMYNDSLAGVVNDAYLKSMGVYGLWYFYNHNGEWMSMGEDIGGETLLESEITYREKAAFIMIKSKEKYKE